MTEDIVSHDDLDAAWDNAQPAEEVAAEEPVEETIDEEPKEELQDGEPKEPELPAEEPKLPEEPAEPEDNGERSKLGRKVKFLEDMVTQQNETIRNLQPVVEQPTNEFEDDEDPVTRGDIEKIIERREAAQRQQIETYNQNYNHGLIKLGLDLEESEHVATVKAVEKILNPSRTGNPEVDAELNFLKARSIVLEGKIKENAKPKNPLNKNKETTPENLGGGADTKTASKTHRMPKLDSAAQDFVKSSGWDADKVKGILSGDTPLNLVDPKGH